MTTTTTTKRSASRLLRKYDKMRVEMRALELELTRACTDYGRSIGVWGYTRDHLRMQLERDEGEAA